MALAMASVPLWTAREPAPCCNGLAYTGLALPAIEVITTPFLAPSSSARKAEGASDIVEGS